MRKALFCLFIIFIFSLHLHALDKIPQHPVIDKFVDYYLNEDYRWFIKAVERYYLYKSTVEKILKREGCPKELALLPIIESGYNGKAVSKSRAVGYWQFIKETAKLYGLNINRYIDERRDIKKSTKAAAKYLRRLYTIFKNWDLAIAAYNSGEGYLLRLIKRTKTKNFWKLLSTGKLRKETAEFVPKFYAVLKILKENKIKINHQKSLVLKEIYVPGNIKLSAISRYTNINYNLILQLNSHLLKEKTPPYGAEIYVPLETASKVIAAIDYIIAEEKAKSLGIKFYRGYWKGYVVRKGDSLWKIAKKFNVSVSLIKTVNLLKNNKLKPGDVLIIPSEKLKKRIILAKPEEKAIIYNVGNGDNLWKVSRVFGVRIGKIMKTNGISYILRPGQKLKIVLEDKSIDKRT